MIEILPAHPFRRSPRHIPLRDYAAQAGSAALRKFEIRRSGFSVDPEQYDPSAFTRTEDVILTVAYPVIPGLYGREDLNDLECVIEADAKVLWETIFSATNYLAGQSLAYPVVQPIDRSSPEVWFQEFVITLVYTEAQTLT